MYCVYSASLYHVYRHHTVSSYNQYRAIAFVVIFTATRCVYLCTYYPRRPCLCEADRELSQAMIASDRVGIYWGRKQNLLLRSVCIIPHRNSCSCSTQIYFRLHLVALTPGSGDNLYIPGARQGSVKRSYVHLKGAPATLPCVILSGAFVR
jgi:hypothetical protein